MSGRPQHVTRHVRAVAPHEPMRAAAAARLVRRDRAPAHPQTCPLKSVHHAARRAGQSEAPARPSRPHEIFPHSHRS